MANNDFTVEKPESGEDQSVALSQDAANALSFSTAEIQGMALSDSGELTISFTDGGSLTINNFRELADNEVQLSLADGGTINSRDLFESLAGSLPAMQIVQPQAGEAVAYKIEAGNKYEFNFGEQKPVAVNEQDGALIITFDDSGILVLYSFADAMDAEMATDITLDGQFLSLREFADGLALAEAMQEKMAQDQEDQQQAETTVRPNDPDELAALAEQLSAIEPAAGEGAAGGRGGFGFQSTFASTPINPLEDVGPIDPTALQFGLPEFKDELFYIDEPSNGGGTPFPPPGVTANGGVDDALVKEDGSVFVPITASVGADSPGTTILTVTVTGIDPSWGVGFTDGSYNAATGTWTVTLPAGTIDYNGGLTFTPPAESDIDLTGLTATATAYDPVSGKSASDSDDFNIIVDAVADDPSIIANGGTDVEGTSIPVDVQGFLGSDDFDGSESITGYQISGATGYTFNQGTDLGGGVWSFTPAELVGLTITANDPDFDGTIVLGATVFTTENPVSDGEFDSSDNNNSATTEFSVTWTPEIDPPTITVNGGIDDAQVKEDGSVDVDVVANLSANAEPSEYLTITITGFDPAWGTVVNADGIGTFNGAGTEWTYTAPAGTNVNTTFTFAPVAESDIDLTGLTAYVTATDPVEGISVDGAPDAFNVIVDAVADDPTIDATGGTKEEGQPIDVTLDGQLGSDLDGSEQITGYQISGVPSGFTFNQGTDAGGGVWTFTPAEIAGLQILSTDTTFAGSLNLTATVFTTENPVSDGEFDTSDNNNQASDGFTVTWEDDDEPVLTQPETVTVDETDLAPTTSVSDKVEADFGDDTPGSFSANGSFTSSVPLTSAGVAVTVTQSGNTYTGTASGETIFTLVLADNGDYTFTLEGVLDHPDATDHNDNIALTFGVTAQDSDGDTADGIITVNVLDDGLTANDDFNQYDDNGIATGNVITGENGGAGAADDLSHDETNTVTKVSFGATEVVVDPVTGATIDGDYGQLTINADGSYTYELFDASVIGTLTTTSLSPEKGDFKGKVQSYTNNGVTVTVEDPDSGELANGTMTYVDTGPHAGGIAVQGNGSKHDGPADQVTVTFADDPVEATLTLVDHGTDNFDDYITFKIFLDGSDVPVIVEGTIPSDAPEGVKEFTFNAEDLGGSEITKIQYFSSNTANGSGEASFLLSDVSITVLTMPECTEDEFVYTLSDGDLDTSTAILNITCDSHNDEPMITTIRPLEVDETDLASGDVIVSDTVFADFGDDAPGTFAANDTFGSSVALTSGGVPVVVTLVGNTYVGEAAGETIFTLEIQADGDYIFTLEGVLDHPDTTDHNDGIDLSFGVTASDVDGDSDTGTINVKVLDDGLTANDDHNMFDASTGVATGNVITGENGGAGAADDLGQDTPNFVTTVSFNGNDVDLAGGTATIDGDFGTLEIYVDGSYTYELFDGVLNGGADEEFNFDPAESDITGGQTSLTKDGITVSTTDGTLTWVNTVDVGSGIGIDGAGSDSPKVWPAGETLDISFEKDVQSVTLTIAELGDNNSNGDYGLDYVITLADGSTVSGDQQFVPGEIVDGEFTFTLDAADYGQLITSVSINSTWGGPFDGASFLLADVDAVAPGTPIVDCAGDVFEYTLTDADGDTSVAQLDLCGALPKLLVGENVSDDNGSNTSYRVGDDSGVITGGIANDVLVGDVGGASLENVDKDYNIVLMLDVSGSMGDPDNAGSRLYKLIEATENLLGDFAAYQGGEVKVHIVPFSTNAHTAGTFTLTDAAGLNAAIDFLSAMPEGGWTNYEAAMQSAIDWLQSGDLLAGAETISYFISDGNPNYYLNDKGDVVKNSDEHVSMDQIDGSADGSDEIATLQSLSDEVIAVGIEVGGSTLSRLNAIDSDGSALNVENADDLGAALQGASPLNALADLGDDIIEGGNGNDLIFGDALNTDQLAADFGLDTAPGASWAVFEQLEAGNGWGRADTVDYIKTHAEDLAAESVNAQGETRQGGDDVLNGGAGDDVIFGQEGNDVLNGGLGNDTLYGGSGADSFLFESIADGAVDTVKDFDASEDSLDLSMLLSGTSATQATIDQFVFANEVGGDTVLSVDLDGSGVAANAADFAVLEGVTGLNLNDLATDGTLIA